MKKAYFYLGKFQPFHNGHLSVLMEMLDKAKKDGAEVYLFSTLGTDIKRPLEPHIKSMLIQHMLDTNPQLSDTVKKYPKVNYIQIKDAPSCYIYLQKKHFTEVVHFAGSDRAEQYQKMILNLKQSEFLSSSLNIDVVSSGVDRTTNSDNISGTKVRQLAYEGKVLEFDRLVDKVYRTPEERAFLMQYIKDRIEHFEKAKADRRSTARASAKPKEKRRSTARASAKPKAKSSAKGGSVKKRRRRYTKRYKYYKRR